MHKNSGLVSLATIQSAGTTLGVSALSCLSAGAGKTFLMILTLDDSPCVVYRSVLDLNVVGLPTVHTSFNVHSLEGRLLFRASFF